MASVKRDDVKQAWEESEFPLVCETCLGDNPYIRMTKEPYGKKCQVCETPFTVFAWQAGTKGRMKRVEICRACAQAKNVCQVCIYDLQYGLPVKVRDRVLRDTAASTTAMAVPQSHANRAWYTAQQQRMIEQGGNAVVDTASANDLAHAKLSEMARMEPRYERNLAKLCSFFARGECDRGDNCPFRHELPRDRNDPLSKQNTKDRFYGTSDPVANNILGRKRRQEQQQQQLLSNNNAQEDEFEISRSTVYIRFQKSNDDNYNNSFPTLTEPDIRDKFYAFGEIVSVRLSNGGQAPSAFIEYTQPEAAELAIASMNRKQLLGTTIFCAWAKAPKRGEPSTSDEQQQQNRNPSSSFNNQSALQPPRLLPPPGGMHATSCKPIPKGLLTVKPPPEVVAMAAARKERLAAGNDSSAAPTAYVPRPGGGPIRGAGVGAAKRVAASSSSQPYYPSAHPNRLGSQTQPPPATS